MNDTIIAAKAKEQHDNFMGKVFTHFSKPKARFVREATYGIQASGDTKLPRGEISINGKVIVNGRILWATGDTVKVLFKDAEGDVTAEADTFESTSADLLTFQCPDGLASDTKYSVVVERTDPNGVMRASAPKTVTARS